MLRMRSRKGVEQRRADEAHEAGEADQIDIAARSRSADRAIVGVAVRVVARAELTSVDAGVARALRGPRPRRGWR